MTWALIALGAALVVQAGWIAAKGRLPSERARQPSTAAARVIAAVMLAAVGACAAGWWALTAAKDPPAWSFRAVAASILVLQVVPLALNQRYPLEREVRRREAARAEPGTPFRWRWVLKAFAILAGCVLLAGIAASVLADLVAG
jgi:hypothetical protein